MQVVGLTGFAGVGKSTAAQYLVERHGFTRLSFAAPLKKMLRTLNPVMGSSRVYSGLSATGSSRPVHLDEVFNKFQGDELAVKASRYGDEYRRLLQVLGTDCIRSVSEDFWVDAAIKQMPSYANGKYVFDDCRFPNEAEVISAMNPLGLWYIEREGVHAANGHASEQHAGKMGEQVFLFNGTGQLEFLHDQIDNAVDMAFQDVKA
jgi:hypothetical protein